MKDEFFFVYRRIVKSRMKYLFCFSYIFRYYYICRVFVHMKEDFYERGGFLFEVKLIKVQARMEIMTGKMKRRASNTTIARTHWDRDNCISTSIMFCPFSFTLYVLSYILLYYLTFFTFRKSIFNIQHFYASLIFIIYLFKINKIKIFK